MKTFKKLISVILCLVITFGVIAVFGVGINKETGLKASAVSHSVGDLVEFGTYPQSEVTDSATLNLLNSQTLSWASYGYYSGTGTWYDGQMTAKDYMKYADVTVNGTRYRAVRFTEYRPAYINYTSSASNSYQYDNGYETNNTYWFKFEPIKWRVLDPTTGLLLCESIIDSQAFNNCIKFDWRDENGLAYWGDEDCTYYANNYEKSSIRAWLNDDFYHTAFSSEDKDNIKTTHLENKAYLPEYSQYDCADTDDKAFLLSYSDMLNTNHGFSDNNSDYDKARRAQGTEYAKCQGLFVYNNSGRKYDGNSYWYLRSPGCDSSQTCSVNSYGIANNDYGHTVNILSGVRAALKISNLNNLPTVGYAEHKNKIIINSTGNDRLIIVIVIVALLLLTLIFAIMTIKSYENKKKEQNFPEQNSPVVTSPKINYTVNRFHSGGQCAICKNECETLYVIRTQQGEKLKQGIVCVNCGKKIVAKFEKENNNNKYV